MLKRKIWFEFRKSSFLKIPGLIIVCFKHKERNINKEGCVSQCMSPKRQLSFYKFMLKKALRGQITKKEVDAVNKFVKIKVDSLNRE